MKLWISLITLLFLIVAAGTLAGWWLGPVKEFAGLNSNSIQGLTGILQIILWFGVALLGIQAFWPQKKKTKSLPEAMAPIQINQKMDGSEGKITNPSQNAVVITGERHHIEIQKDKTFDVTSLRNSYLSYVFKLTRYLSLAGIDRKAASESEARLELEAIYIGLLTQSAEAYEKWQRGEMRERSQLFQSALEQLNRYHHLVLLGDPGSGKTTFINFVTLCLAGEALNHPQANLTLLTTPIIREGEDKEKVQPWNHGALLPVRIVLRDFAARGLPAVGVKATAKCLCQFIRNELAENELGDFSDFLFQEFRETGGILFIDGLDEVPEADQRRSQIKQTVEDFASIFPKCRILVTSRTYAYQKQDWRLTDFSDTILAPFSENQIRLFIEHWYTYVSRIRGLNLDNARGRAELLKQVIFKSDRLKALAERPLLLTLMASLHAWRGGTLPEQREELYADTVDLLLDWWESPKIVRDAAGNVQIQQPSLAEWLRIDRQKVRDLLNEIAFQAHSNQPELLGTADVAEKELISRLMELSQNPDVKPVRLIEYLSQRAGLLIPRGNKVYTFPHRTFQEYLAACYLTDTDYPDLLAKLVLKEPLRWREVALLAGAKAARGAASTVWSLAEALCEKNPPQKITELASVCGALLAGQALVETAALKKAISRHQEKVERINNWLVPAIRLNELPAIERAAAGVVLGQLGDPRLEVTTLDNMQFCYVPAGIFWMGSPKEDVKAWDDERPQHRLEIPYPYWISRFPITNAQFDFFVKADDGYSNKEWWTKDGLAWRGDRRVPDKYGGVFDLPNHPVVMVCWYEALAFTRWLTDYFQSRKMILDNWHFQLPSEAEWEKAARGGEQIPKEVLIQPLNPKLLTPKVKLIDQIEIRRYPWGQEPDANRMNYDQTGIGCTSTVGCFPGGSSAYGCEEMSGNVREWTRSIEKKYPYNFQKDRENLDAPSNLARVVRGGAFLNYLRIVRCSIRFWDDPDYVDRGLGFRVVLFLSTADR